VNDRNRGVADDNEGVEVLQSYHEHKAEQIRARDDAFGLIRDPDYGRGVVHRFHGLRSASPNSRMNVVISDILSNIIYIVGQAIKYDNYYSNKFDFVCTDVISGSHMGIVRLVVDILFMAAFKNSKVIRHMCVDNNLYSIAIRVMKPNSNVCSYRDTNWLMLINEIKARTRAERPS